VLPRAAAVLIVAAALLALPAAAGAQQYQVPLDNPFTSVPGAAPEVYASGLRNPFRFAFDRQTGDLLIGDVGGQFREELDWLTAAEARGANFGWPCREGDIAGPVPDRCPAGTTFAEPVFDYDRPMGPQAVTAGFVVRDPALPSLAGRALYADYFVGDIRSIRRDAGAPDDATTNATVANLAGFGEDAGGRIYAVDLTGNGVHRLVPDPGGLATQALTGPFDGPIAIGAVPGDASRLFLAEREGRIRIIANDAVLPGNFLDISGEVSTDVERGMLSVAAAPDYATSGRIYIFYTRLDGDIVIEEVTRSAGDPNAADPSTRRPLLVIEHSSDSNHNGGSLQFGPDGCLWISTGDGGGQNDLFNNAQPLGSRLGKLLRIDPDPPGRGSLCGGAAPPANPQPPPADTAAPALRTRIARSQRVLRNRGVIAYARCDERCTVAVSARLRIAGKAFRMRSARRTASAGRRVRMKALLTRRQRVRLRRALRRGRRPVVAVTLNARDGASNRSPSKRARVRVRR
jgi:glucose/arabinose dehydrogenase